tara:strand:- start:4642 stop:5439 length:798 start_codon:yes stop_codon:yes gene_type:complete
MKKYIVIGNPIEHSLSPKLHNYWFKLNNITANYEKELLDDNELENFANKIKDKQIHGANVTVPFKEKIISYVDTLSEEAKAANSVNTLYLSEKKIIGHNTDIVGFYHSLKNNFIKFKFDKALILGSGGASPSIIVALKRLGVKKIFVSNRTKDKAVNLKKKFKFIEVINWGETVKADIIINTTSLGLNMSDKIDLNYDLFGSESFFYDLIYKPENTNFLENAKKRGNSVQNGLMMFVYQAAESFKIWHGINPKIDEKLIDFLKYD